MSLLTSILPKIPHIVSLYSGIKSEYEKLMSDTINEEQLAQSTEEMKNSLLVKTQELIDILSGVTSEENLANSCLDLSRRIRSQADAIAHSLNRPINRPSLARGIERIESNILTLEARLLSHYEARVASSDMLQKKTKCFREALDLVRKGPPPVFEEDFEEYARVAEGVNIEYSEDERASLNRKMLQLPGMASFILSLVDVGKRQHVLGLVKKHEKKDPTAIPPFSEGMLTLLPCVRVLDLDFSSEDELRTGFFEFFRGGNWLESYVFMMLDRAGCSTRLLNAKLSWDSSILEADVLALFAGDLFIFEAKDRAFSSGLMEDDVRDINSQLKKIANLTSIDLHANYVISVDDQHQDAVESKIKEIATSKGVSVKVTFLDNTGSIDRIVAKIGACLR